ncbi:MAG: helix-turn-helix domain-containing protein [Acidimicrobiales bacterium]
MAEATLTKVHQGFSYRLDPTPDQRTLLASHAGASRFCHNFLLGLVLANWKENRERKEAGELSFRTSEVGFTSPISHR